MTLEDLEKNLKTARQRYLRAVTSSCTTVSDEQLAEARADYINAGHAYRARVRELMSEGDPK